MTMRTFKTLLLIPLLGVFLAACGSNQDDLVTTNLARNLGKRLVSNDKEAAAAAQAAVLAVTREQVDASPLPLLRVRIEGTGAMSTLAEIDRKGDYSTYFTNDGIALMFRGGMLIQTRGLGQDLMGLSAPGLRAAADAGKATRIYRYLDGNEKLVNVTMTCLVERSAHAPITILGRVHRVDQLAEYCSGTDLNDEQLVIENFYWVESGTSTVWQSRQYISGRFGRAEIEVLKR